MKYFSIFLCLIGILSSCGSRSNSVSPELKQLYATLDEEISKAPEYDKVKEERIANLRKEYTEIKDEDRRTDILNSLAAEFNSYNADSALFYVNANLYRPAIKANLKESIRLQIHKADIFAHAGLFSDALDVLEKIPRDMIPPELLEDYFSTHCATYQYLSEYTSEHVTSQGYETKRALYADSLRQVTPSGSFNEIVYVLTEAARKGETERAISELTRHLSKYPSGTREYSIIASTLAYIYKTVGRDEDYKKNLVLSAISDVRGSVKENMSFREMATVMFEDGDVEHANNYLKKSFSDANFYSALMRNAQSSKMLPVIDEAYSNRQKQLTSRLRIMMWSSVVLCCILIATVFLILKQFRSLRRANEKIQAANEELSRMSSQLKASNGELAVKNEELAEKNNELADKNQQLIDSNRTKEQYAGLFMEYCSSAISTLHSYQKSLKVLAAQGGNRAALVKKLESTDISEQMLKNFYLRFDEAILKLYPDFVEKFNVLLLPDERIILKTGELLSTEIRLYALIRVGIEDSTKIAQFLRCSISTVYTYRSKMKKRAISPDTFEEDVKTII